LKSILLHLFIFLLVITPVSLQAQGPGSALKFDGSDDYVVCGSSNRGISNSITVEAWVKTSSSKYHWVVGKYDRYGGERGYHLIIKDGRAAFAGRDGSGYYRNSGYTPILVNDGRWHHLTGISHNGTWQIYVDGILSMETSTGYSATNLTNTAPLALGKDFMADNENFVGQMDEVRIWKKALSLDEIRQSMCSKLKDYADNPDLVAYFNFDSPGGSTVKDLSSQKLDGTFRNMSPSTAWVTSGAPIGDRSVYRYGTSWLHSLDLVTNSGAFFIRRAIAGTKAFHIYVVESAPNQTNGISDPDGVQEYYGLFKIGEPDYKYDVWLHQPYLTCGAELYRREDNSVNTWVHVAESLDLLGMTYQSSAYYGEYAAVAKKIYPIEINGPNTICPGERATLSIKATNGTVLWNTGAKTNSIEVTQGGTYTVTVTDNGCQRSASITLETECLIIPNIITPNGDGKNDTFVLEGISIDQVEVEIFNRWGASVYKRNTYDNKWSTATTGMYYYHIKSHQTGKVYKGWVEVVR
jgi:gliding motility-associated-like protein